MRPLPDIKIAFVGTACVGKTTVIKHIENNRKNFPLLKNCEFTGSMTQKAMENGFGLNESSSEITQKYLYDLYVENSKLNNTIEDRCVLDNVCYSIFLKDVLGKEIDVNFINKSMQSLPEILSRYRYIFYLPIEIPLIGGKTNRTVSEEHRKAVDGIYQNLIENLWDNHKIRITTLSGNIDQKILQLHKTFYWDEYYCPAGFEGVQGSYN